MSQDIYKIAFERWLLEFQSKFNKSESSSVLEIFVLNKDFFSFPEKRGNTNDKILYKNIFDFKNGNVCLLDGNTWKSIKSKYPNEREFRYNTFHQSHTIRLHTYTQKKLPRPLSLPVC